MRAGARKGLIFDGNSQKGVGCGAIPLPAFGSRSARVPCRVAYDLEPLRPVTGNILVVIQRFPGERVSTCRPSLPEIASRRPTGFSLAFWRSNRRLEMVTEQMLQAIRQQPGQANSPGKLPEF